MYEFDVTGKPDILKGKGASVRGQFYIDGRMVGQVEMPVTNQLSLGLASGVAVGKNAGAPVTDDYEPPFRFTGPAQ